LLGHQLGDEVLVQLPRGERTYKVVELVTLPQMVS
jgi:transcription elongation GreA/GreB family factor